MNWLTFHLERLLLKGAHYRLLVMAIAVAAVAIGGGLALNAIGEPESIGDASWWAFLRLTDPGYLGDDEGLGRRIISVLVTIAGYVLFMGALIAILTQWLHETVERLQRGETPIVMQNHVLVLGLTRRTPMVIEELMRSAPRFNRYFQRNGSNTKLRVVVLVEELNEGVRAELSARLGDVWDDQAILLRSGSPLVAGHLQRVDFARAAVVLVPGGGDAGEQMSARDANTIKTVLSIANHPAIVTSETPPRIVAEVFDAALIDIVGSVYSGALELIPNGVIVSRLIAQNLRHSGLSWVLSEILAFHSGNDLFYKHFPAAVGERFRDVARRLRGGVTLGVVRGEGTNWTPHLNPPADFRLGSGDRLVVIAKDSDEIRLVDGSTSLPAEHLAVPLVSRNWPKRRRILILGWSRRVPSLISELNSYAKEDFSVDVMSILPVEEREALVQRTAGSNPRTSVRQLNGDYTHISDITALDLGSYDNIVIVGRSWFVDGEYSDAQTILAYTIVHASLSKLERRPSLLVELTDPDNALLLEEQPGEIVMSPVFMARVLAHIAIRPELVAVLDELFTVGGAELHFRSPDEFGLEMGTTSFETLQAVVMAHDELLIGVRVSDVAIDIRGDLELAPDASETFQISPHTLLLALTTQALGEGN